MSLEDRFLIPPEVIHQTIDEEVILVHLGLGTYHSLRGCGPALFAALAAGASGRELAALLAGETDADAATIEAAVAKFLQSLLGEQLVELAPGTSAAPAAAIAAADPTLSRRPFEAPLLETFNDLRDLLNADPVHDVDPAGWPVMAAAERAAGE